MLGVERDCVSPAVGQPSQAQPPASHLWLGYINSSQDSPGAEGAHEGTADASGPRVQPQPVGFGSLRG